MELQEKHLCGQVKIFLFNMDREYRSGENKELNAAVAELRKKIRSPDGVSISALESGESLIMEIGGMMFWVNCRLRRDGQTYLFVSSRKKVI